MEREGRRVCGWNEKPEMKRREGVGLRREGMEESMNRLGWCVQEVVG